MNKFFPIILFISFTLTSFGQTLESVAEKEKLFHKSKDKRERINLALDIIEEYTYLSQVDRAQQWTYQLVELNYNTNNDTIDYYIKSNQAEIFYWCNLFDYADQPAKEALKIAERLHDSTFISNAAMFVSYVKEMQDSLKGSIQYAHYAHLYYPRVPKTGYRIMIKKSQIINNLAQIYVKLKMVDSALYYNQLAYPLSIQEKSERALIYCDYNYANIYTFLHKKDSALFYFQKSNENAEKYKKYDLLLQNYTAMLDLYPNNPAEQDNMLQKCFNIIDNHEIAPLNKGVFYKKAIQFFKQYKNDASLALLQDKYITLQDEISTQGNLEVQKISQRFVKNENHFLQLKIQDLNHQRKLTLMQMFSVVSVLLLGMIAYYFYNRKRKTELESKIQQQKVVAYERYRIANDIHDDLGSNLSRIRYIINALPEISTREELQKNYQKVISLSDDSVDKMNEIIWSLKQEEFTIDELISYIRKMSNEISEEKKIKIIFSYKENISLELIKAEVCRNLYLTVKEALHNAIKHSKASLIEISANLTNRLTIQVSDNGIGFNRHANQGNGMGNMQKRMQTIGGEIKIDTSNQGTQITMSSPIL